MPTSLPPFPLICIPLRRLPPLLLPQGPRLKIARPPPLSFLSSPKRRFNIPRYLSCRFPRFPLPHSPHHHASIQGAPQHSVASTKGKVGKEKAKKEKKRLSVVRPFVVKGVSGCDVLSRASLSPWLSSPYPFPWSPSSLLAPKVFDRKAAEEEEEEEGRKRRGWWPLSPPSLPCGRRSVLPQAKTKVRGEYCPILSSS